jgi:hypothetical protein
MQDLEQFRASQQQQQQQPISEDGSSLFVSMKNLEKDLETFKQLYDEEIRFMRAELEEISAHKNKLSLDKFNLETKLQDLTSKLEDFIKFADCFLFCKSLHFLSILIEY